MRTMMVLVAAATIALSQQTERNLSFRNLQSDATFAEAATVIRSIGEIRNLRVDALNRSIYLTGDPKQAALADWLFPKLDGRPDNATLGDSVQFDYRPTDSPDDIVRVFYFRYSNEAGKIHQMATVIRSLTEIRRAFVSMAAGAFVVRGTQVQMDTAKWLIESLDKPAVAAGAQEYRVPGTPDESIGLFPAPTVGSDEELKDLASRLVVAVGPQRVFTYYPLRIIAVRSTSGKIQDASKLLQTGN